MKKLPILTLLATVLFHTTPLLAQADVRPVGELGQLAKIQFTGQRAYSEAALRSSLRYELDFLLAAEPEAPLADCLQTLERLLRAGYQHAGYADAEIQVTATNQIVVRIQEGPRLRCGDVRVAGLKQLAVADVLERFRQQAMLEPNTNTSGSSPGVATVRPGELPPLTLPQTMTLVTNWSQLKDLTLTRWEPGSPAMLDAASRHWLAVAATNAFADLGHFRPNFKLDFVRRSAPPQAPGELIVDMVIVVADEGPACTVGEIRIVGVKRNPADDVRRRLGLQPGQPLAAGGLEAHRQRLVDCGRFGLVEIEEAMPDREGRVDLAVRLTELPEAPLLSEPLPPETEALLRVRRWVLGWESRQEDLVLRWRGVTKASRGSTTVPVDFIATPAGGLLLRVGADAGGGSTNLPAFALLLRRGLAGVYAASLDRKFVTTNFQGGVSVFANVKPRPAGSGDGFFIVEIGAGFQSETNKPPFTAKLDLPPAAFVYASADFGPDMWHLDGPTLAAKKEQLTFRADAATGRLIEWRGASHAGPKPEEYGVFETLALSSMEYSVSFEPGAYTRAEAELVRASAGLTNACDSEHPISSGATYLAGLLWHSPAVRSFLPSSARTKLTPDNLRTAGLALDRFFSEDTFAPLNQLFSNTLSGDEDSFVIPSSVPGAESPMSGSMSAIMARILATSGELAPRNSWLNTSVRLAVFRFADQAERVQPEMSRLLAGDQMGPLGCLVLAQAAPPAGARQLALRGLMHTTPENFMTDCHVLLDEDAVLGQILASFFRALGRFDDQEVTALAALLPEADATFLRRTAAVMREAPAGPLANALQPALEQWWRAAVKAWVQEELRKLSRPPSRPASQ